MELELKHVQSYPMGKDGVNILLPKHQLKYGEQAIFPLNGVSIGTENELQLEMLTPDDDLIFTYEIEISKCKLVLRPLSDLTKEIEVNGEKFVPISRLMEIAEGEDLDQFEPYKYDSNEACYGVKYTDIEGYICSFAYHHETNHFGLLVIEGGRAQTVLYQYELLQKLLEWHFDIHGLIKEGLAIDINTL